MAGQTRGLLLTGGEPTLAPNFSETLSLARKYHFVDVIVVTNGSFLDEPAIAEALISKATAVRVSLYDWEANSLAGLEPTLRRIESLRSRVEQFGSKLQIGVSALTSTENAPALKELAARVSAAGAHWIYIHPLCRNWDAGKPRRIDQHGVLEAVNTFRGGFNPGFEFFIFEDRYRNHRIRFQGYHTAHFLLVIGADTKNYLGAEVKYQPGHVLFDFNGKFQAGFLWQAERRERIARTESRTYPALGSRHRGVLYNDLIERLLEERKNHPEKPCLPARQDFSYPYIL